MRHLIDIMDFSVEELQELIATANDIIAHPEEYREKMKFICSFYVPLGWRSQYCGLFELQRGGVTWYFLDNEYYFKRGEPYGYFDDGERMAFFGGGQTASCGKLLRWYREQDLTVPVQQAQPGDIAIYNFCGTMEPEHCGLITEVKMAITTIASVKSIEGNTTTSNGSESNGGCVAEKTRFTKNIVAVCRPQYKPEEPEIPDDVSGHWAKASIEWAKEQGLIKGYPDGSFKPDKPVTRAELAVILHRIYSKPKGG